MSATTFDIQEAQTKLTQLLALALKGADVIISEGDQPLVRLVPVRSGQQDRIAGLHRGAMHMRSDFNDPLPDEFWLGTE